DELNRMAVELKEWMQTQQALSMAMEVQQSLLPAATPSPRGLDIAGESRFCDATGGDYYDFIDVSETGDQATLIALGDVMGHGVAAALLMASARAALRAHASEEGSLARLMTKVNQVLAEDNRHQRFMTMVLAVVEPTRGAVRWASAGHDPMIHYDPSTDSFRELEGGDLPLGVMEGTDYSEYRASDLAEGSILMIGTDGIWEARNEEGEMFGKERLRDAIRRNHQRPAADIGAAIEADLDAFCGAGSPTDDVTFVIARVTASPSDASADDESHAPAAAD
ncbi:MAG: PP2C family protein-serine/threonine phosphatase, partial [Planctomycetota bacterium]|nr:PP2C family protein-serine/threonine phosphatase [Planctomycetota bacterium]